MNYYCERDNETGYSCKFGPGMPEECSSCDARRIPLDEKPSNWVCASEPVVAANSASANSAMPKFCPYHKSGAQCIWGLRGCCKESLPCEVRAELRQ
jgi:hypothetical protein